MDTDVMQDVTLVDTHAHICDAVFDADRVQVLDRAQKAGVAAIIAVGEDAADAHKNLGLAALYPCLHPAAGLYPTQIDFKQADEMGDLIRCQHHRLAAIGEVGLDYWVVKDASKRELQRQIFKKFILLSKELHLPLNVHSRSAGRHAVAFLLENGATQVQMHAFDGRAKAALPAVEAGYFFSIPPSVVRSRQKQKLVKQLPLSCLLVESDSPVLGPHQGQRNEPGNIPLAVDAIARLKGVSTSAVATAIRDNTVRLYPHLSAKGN